MDGVIVETIQAPQPCVVTLALSGLTCASCVGNVTRALVAQPYIISTNVNLLTMSAVVCISDRGNAHEVVEVIQDAGYDATVDKIEDQRPRSALVHRSLAPDPSRTVEIRVEGMHSERCVDKVVDILSGIEDVKVDRPPSLRDPTLRVTYTPRSPNLTVRTILSALSSTDAAFNPHVFRPPTVEERSRQLQQRERRQILCRLFTSVAIAIPTFIIGIVLMTLVPKDHRARQYIMGSLAGVSRAEWALLIMATPVYFFCADLFHRRTVTELRALWRSRSRTPIIQRFYRFGSMNMLISLGTTIAYVSSIVEMGIAGAKNQHGQMFEHGNSTYFDSVVFLTMFLLIGRYIEAYSKAKTGDAVASLGKLRPKTALLQIPDPRVIGKGAASDGYETVEIDLIDCGDIVRVPHGASPPCDGIIKSGTTMFNESSLTGESRPLSKKEGDQVYSGTINLGPAVSIRVTGVSGNSMLDQIIKVVREGQAKRAPVERVADRITGIFVPLICVLAVLTWLIWFSLGLSGTLPIAWRDTTDNWPFWSLRFAIAVFVVACPCGIGLAAPTALFVGGGLAAKFGILVKGGGEAFQEASNLDCIVFDKTGTLTEGGEPTVTDFRHINECPDVAHDEEMVLAIARVIEEDSSHPLAKAIVAFSRSKLPSHNIQPPRVETQEIPGQGMRSVVQIATPSSANNQEFEVVIGNEKLMHDRGAKISPIISTTLHTWKQQGKSVMIMSLRECTIEPRDGEQSWCVVAIFAVSDPIRAEAPGVIAALHKRSIDVWMLSGDNAITAYAIGDQVGIPHENIIAEVLPTMKAEKIKMLQSSKSKHSNRRAIVAMVGDGINDSPALTQADVGIAIGSGSDVAINAASFVLLTSNLNTVLTLIDLSRLVFRRIKFNFFWALVYNLVALPVAAGALYPITTGSGSHVRLDPAWAALAMALSSVSVVCSSLLLRSSIPDVGFRAKTKTAV